jgi:hypothetical protein
MGLDANDQDRSQHRNGQVSSAESSQTLRLESGRSLGYAEWGDASGFPLVHFHGSSSSRLEHPVQQEVLAGVRLVTIDRPVTASLTSNRNARCWIGKDPEGAARRRFASAPAPDQQALSDRRATDMLLASMVESFRAGSDKEKEHE